MICTKCMVLERCQWLIWCICSFKRASACFSSTLAKSCMCSVWEVSQCRWPQVLSLMRAGLQSGSNVEKYWNLLLKCRKVNTINYKPRAAHLINHVVLPADIFPLFQQHTAPCTESLHIKYFCRRWICIQKNMYLIYNSMWNFIVLFRHPGASFLIWWDAKIILNIDVFIKRCIWLSTMTLCIKHKVYI